MWGALVLNLKNFLGLITVSCGFAVQLGESAMKDGSSASTKFEITGSSTVTYARIEVTDHTVNEQLTGLAFSGREGDLLVEFQLSDTQGSPIFNDAYVVFEGWSRDQKELVFRDWPYWAEQAGLCQFRTDEVRDEMPGTGM